MNFIIVFLLSIILSLLLISIYNYIRIGHFFLIKKQFLGTFTIYIPNVLWETEEQYYLKKYISKDDIVLQLGGNIGTSCILVDKIVDNKERQICVEPNKDIYDLLLYNKHNTSSKFQIIDSVVTDNSNIYMLKTGHDDIEFSTTTEFTEDKVKNIRLENLNQFNVLFADCEGCLCPFLTEYPQVLNRLNKVIYEKDKTDICNYINIETLLSANGFSKVVNGFVCVWLK